MITSYGEVIPQSAADLKINRADEKDPIVAKAYQSQIESLAKRGIYLDIAMPAKAGALIAQCTASEAEHILDAAFGIHAFDHSLRPAVRYEPSVVQDVKYNMTMTMTFGSAARGEFKIDALKSAFGAVAPRAADNDIGHAAPALNVA
jgi:hypothetical protein